LKAAIEADEAEDAALDDDDDEESRNDKKRRRGRRVENGNDDVIDDDAELDRIRAAHRLVQQQHSANRLVVAADGSVQQSAPPPPPTGANSVTSSSSTGRSAREYGIGRRCGVEGCGKWGQGRKTSEGYRCARHGGGQKCLVPNCPSLNHGGGYCTAHGGGRRRAGAEPRALKAAAIPDVYRETYLKTNDVIQARKVAISAPIVAAASDRPAPRSATVRSESAPSAINPVYLRQREKVAASAGNKRRATKQTKKLPRKSPAPVQMTDSVAAELIVYDDARFATRSGLSSFVDTSFAVAHDNPEDFPAAATRIHMATLPGAAELFTVSPFVCTPYGSMAVYERLARLDSTGDGTALPLFNWWKHRRELIKALAKQPSGGVIVKQLFLPRNLRKAQRAAVKPKASASASTRTATTTASALPDIGSDGVSVEDIAPPPVDIKSLILPDVVQPKPGFLDSLATPQPKRNAADVLMSAARANSRSAPSTAATTKRKRGTDGATSKAAVEREKALFTKSEPRKSTKRHAVEETSTAQTPKATTTTTRSEAAQVGRDAGDSTAKRSTRSDKTKEFFHLPTGGWFDNRMASTQQQQAGDIDQRATTITDPVAIDDGIGQDEFA
jgi:hypothetical protein